MYSHWECFRDAVLVLAGTGQVKQRLLEAYQNHLRHVATDDLPRELREPFGSLKTALQSSRRTGTLDSASASVLKMSDGEAAAHARSIVQIFVGLQEPPANRPAAVLRAVPDEDEIPAFLNRA